MSEEIIDQTIISVSRVLNKLAQRSENNQYDEDVDKAYELVSELKDQLLKLRKKKQ
ncbi:hypothetical protein [Nostoc sp. MG11]|uniref:hypothetical protein n=1 Tax=Nostoc sp. MG11 TaxID=2721166 RepID=UPI001865ACFA|nr:hypothetical protein [Nostoc sp. MG11]